MTYRVVFNESTSHPQWIVVCDDGKPVMVAGPFADDAAAELHCRALNREATRERERKSRFDIGLFTHQQLRFISAGWLTLFRTGWLDEHSVGVALICAAPTRH